MENSQAKHITIDINSRQNSRLDDNDHCDAIKNCNVNSMMKIVQKQIYHDNQMSINESTLKFSKNTMQALTKDTLDKYRHVRQKQLQQQISILKEDITLLQSHLTMLSEKYKEKREEANRNQYNYMEMNEKYENLREKYESLEEKYQAREKEIMNNCNKKIQYNNEQYQNRQQKYQAQIQALSLQIQSLKAFINQSQKQYTLVKGLLNSQVMKRKNKQDQYTKEINMLKREISNQKQIINSLKKEISQKTIEIINKNQHLRSMEKCMKEMNKRVIKIEANSKKQIIKERAITKRAIDSLQVTKKYSEIQLSKSRKKEKMYLHSQKQLICKIKEICKDQSTIQTTTGKSSRKTEVRSLNTTLKSFKDGHHTPLVSKFITQDEPPLELSPIHQVSPFKVEASKYSINSKKEHKLSSIKSVSHLDLMKNKIQSGFYVDPYSAGTPCFEDTSKTKMFKAVK